MKIKDVVRHITLTTTQLEIKETIGPHFVFSGSLQDLININSNEILNKTINSIGVKNNKLILFAK